MVKQKIPPRLFIIFAKEAQEAVIFRRGPAAWYHLIRWDTENDKFYPGAWVKGTIYPERCDLSPDGKLLLYFVLQGSRYGSTYKGTWSAVSRSPWLFALGLWPEGPTWDGGGRFIDNRTIALRHFSLEPHPDHLGEGLTVHSCHDFKRGSEYEQLPHHHSTNEIKGAEWTDRDQRGRLIYTFDGKVMHRRDEKEDAICLLDLNNMTPDPQPAPDSARKPLPPLKKIKGSKRTGKKLRKKAINGRDGEIRKMAKTIPGGIVHELPADLKKALAANAAALATWVDITPIARNEWICWVDSAKKAETRLKRINWGIENLVEGKRRPCCWPGCKHR